MRRTHLRTLLTRVQTIQVALAVLTVAVALGLFLGYRAETQHADAVHASLTELQELRGDVFSAETAVRGFVLTGRPSFLAPYERALPRIDDRFTALAKELRTDELPRLEAARRAVGAWRAQFAERVLLAVRTGESERALALARTGQGKRRTDRFRRHVNALSATLERRLAASRDEISRWSVVGMGGIGLAATVTIAVSAALRRRLAASVVEPMQQLSDVAERLGGGDLAARTRPAGVAEVAIAGAGLNHMAARVEQLVSETREHADMKTRFVSQVSHEMRTPLTSVRGFLEELDGGFVGDLTPEQQETVGLALRNAGRLQTLIDDLLLLSRLEAGRVELASDPVELGELVAGVCAAMRPVAAASAVDLRVSAPAAVGVTGDAARLEQTFTNLIANAIKFTVSGAPVDIRVSADAGEAVVEVEDRGVGIPAADLPRIAERFFRASTAVGIQGTGLGLTISREIVERHGGRLEVRSVEGQGSTFRVALPVAVRQARVDGTEAQPVGGR